MRSRDSRSGILGVACLALLLAAPPVAYVSGYFLVSERRAIASAEYRLFGAKWQYNIYWPAVRLESWLTSQDLDPAWKEPPPKS